MDRKTFIQICLGIAVGVFGFDRLLENPEEEMELTFDDTGKYYVVSNPTLYLDGKPIEAIGDFEITDWK